MTVACGPPAFPILNKYGLAREALRFSAYVPYSAHREHSFRYVPEVEIITVPKALVLMNAINAHIDAIDDQFKIWNNPIMPEGALDNA